MLNQFKLVQFKPVYTVMLNQFKLVQLVYSDVKPV